MNKAPKYFLSIFVAAALSGCIVKDFNPQNKIEEKLSKQVSEIDEDIEEFVDKNTERMISLKRCLERSENPKRMCWDGIYEQVKFQAYLCGLIARRDYLSSYISRNADRGQVPEGRFDFESECNSIKDK